MSPKSQDVSLYYGISYGKITLRHCPGRSYKKTSRNWPDPVRFRSIFVALTSSGDSWLVSMRPSFLLPCNQLHVARSSICRSVR
jgi:hypothetical protein